LPTSQVNLKRLFQFLAILSALTWTVTAEARPLQSRIESVCIECAARMVSQTGAYILEKGEESLIGRAWLAQHATESIDVQYFIWSTDNVGILAAERLLSAAERGVAVRVLVDDLLIDAEKRTLLLLSAHPNAQIRVYNPVLTVGVGFWQKVKNVFTDFRAVNQRMHDKTAIFDGVVGITGGRNMADEYFDFDHAYNFRDRDILLVGAAVREMTANFEEFWDSEYAVPVEEILAEELEEISGDDTRQRARELHAYAADTRNFAPEVREAVEATGEHIEALLQMMVWDDMTFISDIPGKNAGEMGLGGGGRVDATVDRGAAGRKRVDPDPIAVPGHARTRNRVIQGTGRPGRPNPDFDELAGIDGQHPGIQRLREPAQGAVESRRRNL
jgi:putative cardiolipin synthase